MPPTALRWSRSSSARITVGMTMRPDLDSGESVKLLLASDVSFMAMGGYAAGRREQCTEACTADA